MADHAAHAQAGAVARDRGHLVSQALASTGGHQHERIAAGQDVADHLLLQAAEGGIAPDGAQNVERVASRARGRPEPSSGRISQDRESRHQGRKVVVRRVDQLLTAGGAKSPGGRPRSVVRCAT